MKLKIYLIVLVLVLLVSCTTQQNQEIQQQEIPAKPETTGTTAPAPPEEPEEELKEEPQEEEIIKIPNDIREILEKGKTKLKSYSYNYKNPESDLAYKISVKDKNIRITLPEANTDDKDKRYNTIYLDTETKTAQAHCIGYSDCEGTVGKVKDLDYESAYIDTPLDWLEKVTSAEVIDERQVEGREAFYLNTNIGKITVESYYGFLYKLEERKKVWEFTDASFNSVKDSDVIPS